MAARKKSRLRSINPEWWLVLSLFGVSLAVAVLPFDSRITLFLYIAPVMVAAYLFGKRMAVLTAVACVMMVISGAFFRDVLLTNDVQLSLAREHWGELLTWAAMLMGFGWALGWLFGDAREMNDGFIDIMRFMVGRDNDRHNYVRRLSYISGVVAEELGMTPIQCETIRRAALLRDISQLELSRDVFRRFSAICQQDDEGQGPQAMERVSLGEVMDLVLAEKIHGSKYDRQPVGARILALAADYDDLTTSKKRRSALPASVARTMIERESGKKFDAAIVRAFSRACDGGAFSPAARRVSMAVGD